MDPDDPTPAPERGRIRRALHFAPVVLLSISALGTSWSGYQSTLWSGEQGRYANEGIVLRTRSTRASTRAGQVRVIDVAVFTNWLAAYAHHDTLLANLYAHRFRDEFKVAFERWIAMRPLVNDAAPPTPFQMQDYRLALADSAERLEVAADSVAFKGIRAGRLVDSYVLDAVIFATVMFFASTAQQTKAERMRIFLAAIALLIFCSGAYRLFVQPRG